MPLHLMTRRTFLQAASAAIGAASVCRDVRSEPSDPTWYALLSDTHIAADSSLKHRDECMAENLRAVVADVLARETKPAAVFVDGDLALKNGQPGDYQTFLAQVEPIRAAKLPLHLTLGNHDDRAHFRDGLKSAPPGDSEVIDKHVSTVGGDGVRFVMLDSLDHTDATPGLLGERQLRWLARALDRDAKAPAVLFIHHNLSNHEGALTDTDALLKVIVPRRQVKAVVYGHSHRWAIDERDGIHLINLPAVAYRFADDQPLGWCRFWPKLDGGELELRCIGGDKSKDRERVQLKWRGA